MLQAVASMDRAGGFVQRARNEQGFQMADANVHCFAEVKRQS
jgi:hypothetical protein